jgi:hypothetical protein
VVAAAGFHEWLSAWSTAAAAVVVSVSAVVAVVQLVELKKARQGEGVFHVLGVLNSEAMAKQREELLRTAPLPPAGSLPDGEFQAAWRRWRPVSIAFDQVGLLAQEGMVPPWIVLDMYRDTIVNTWDTLEPYILRERARRPFPLYQYHFEWLYEEACRFRRRPYDDHPPTHRFRTT